MDLECVAGGEKSVAKPAATLVLLEARQTR